MKKEFFNTIFFILISLFISCKNMKTKYEKVKCGKPIVRDCPFALNVEKYKINEDTLYLTIDVINMNNRIEIIDRKLHCSIFILYDSILTRGGFTILHYNDPLLLKYDNKGKQLISCDNCFEEYQNSTKFVKLDTYEKYSFVNKHHVQNLDKIPKGYNFYINYEVYSPIYNSYYCPQVWSGSVQIVTKITK